LLLLLLIRWQNKTRKRDFFSLKKHLFGKKNVWNNFQ
jgi:hypothetical protein